MIGAGLRPAALILALLLGACSGRPPLREQSTDFHSANLGLAVVLSSPIPLMNLAPTVIYFAKIDPENGLLQPDVIASNVRSRELYYATNVQPGTYAAVGAQVTDKGVGFTIYFSSDVVARTKTTVGGRELAFMGEYWLYMIPGLWGGDAVQKHYASVITPVRSWSALNFFFGDLGYRGVLLRSRKDEKARGEFMRFAKEDMDRHEAALPGVRVADRFFWTGPDGNLGLELRASFESRKWLERVMRPDTVIGSFKDKNPPHDYRDWTLREILVSVNLNTADAAAVWRVSGPRPLITAYAEALTGASRKSPLIKDVSYKVVNFRAAAE